LANAIVTTADDHLHPITLPTIRTVYELAVSRILQLHKELSDLTGENIFNLDHILINEKLTPFDMRLKIPNYLTYSEERRKVQVEVKNGEDVVNKIEESDVPRISLMAGRTDEEKYLIIKGKETSTQTEEEEFSKKKKYPWEIRCDSNGENPETEEGLHCEAIISSEQISEEVKEEEINELEEENNIERIKDTEEPEWVSQNNPLNYLEDEIVQSMDATVTDSEQTTNEQIIPSGTQNLQNEKDEKSSNIIVESAPESSKSTEGLYRLNNLDR